VNVVGTTTIDSNICTLTVARNYSYVNEPTVYSDRIDFDGGLKPSTNGRGDEQWWEWSPGYGDIYEINGSTVIFGVKGRFCDWQVKLELRITKSTNGSTVHWGDQTKSAGRNGIQNYNISANGGGWNPENDGVPTFRLMVIDNGTNCTNTSGQDVGCEDSSSWLDYTYKRRTYTYYYDSRP
jgi:hypothetical protein